MYLYDGRGETVTERAGQVDRHLDEAAAAAAAQALFEALQKVQNLTGDLGFRDRA
ncbi:hypothetical protein [Streptomyces longisporoflavus]|uniref:Uncharacterized protein n=1 Tax=Streptomyces longisporoflavus TaxID=28044 RepID=A0ABW7R8M2_9ACTN